MLTPDLSLRIERCKACRRLWPALCARHTVEAEGRKL